MARRSDFAGPGSFCLPALKQFSMLPWPWYGHEDGSSLGGAVYLPACRGPSGEPVRLRAAHELFIRPRPCHSGNSHAASRPLGTHHGTPGVSPIRRPRLLATFGLRAAGGGNQRPRRRRRETIKSLWRRRAKAARGTRPGHPIGPRARLQSRPVSDVRHGPAAMPRT